MFCHNCGKQLENPGRFCHFCGVELKTPAPQAAQPVPPIQQVPQPVPPVRQPAQQTVQQPVNPNTVVYEGAAAWNEGGIRYHGCYMVMTYGTLAIFKNKRKKDSGEALVVENCSNIIGVRMAGNINGPYLELSLASGRKLYFQTLLHIGEIHTASQKVFKFYHP